MISINEQKMDKPHRNVIYLKILSIVILSIVPFIFSLNADFVFDDSEAVLNNKDVSSNATLVNAFYNDFWGTPIDSNNSHKSYRPLTVLSFRFNKYLSGNQLVPYHFKLTNILCHSICCLLFWKWLNTMIKSVHKKTPKNISTSIDKGYLSSLLFTIHPIHTEAVSGIVGRADLLAAIFFFVTLILYDKCKSVSTSKNQVYEPPKLFMGCNSLIPFSAVICAVVSMLFKETGITVLMMCIAYDIIIIEQFNPGVSITDVRNHANNKHITKQIIIQDKKKTIPINVLLKKLNMNLIHRTLMVTCSAIVILYFRWRVMGEGGPAIFSKIDNPAAFSDNISTKILSYSYIYFLNLTLLVWPQWLCFDWSMGCVPLLTSLQDVRVIFVIFFYVCLLCCVYTILDRRKFSQFRSLWCMGACLLLIPFLPASNLLVRVGFVVAERVLYLPSAGLCMLTVMGFEKICHYKGGAYRKVAYVSFAMLVLTFTLRTQQRAADWSSESSLFYSGLNVCPLNAKVHYNIAKVNQLHRPDIAEDEYREALRLNPEYYNAMNNLGNLLRVKGNYEEAETLFLQALSIKEDFPAAWMNLGVLLAGRGEGEGRRAEEAYRRALSYRPNYADCYYNMGNMYLSEKRNEDAMSAWLSAIDISPAHELAWTNLLAMLDNTAQTERAMHYLPVALQRLPESGAVHFTGANLLGRLGRLRDAEAHFLLALRLLGPKLRPIHYSNLGILYHRWKKYRKAEDMYERALKLDPSLKHIQEHLHTVKIKIKRSE